jgi:glutathione S-transferase
MAIILFLEDAFPHCGPALLGEDVLTRATVTEMAEIINSGIQPLQVLG